MAIGEPRDLPGALIEKGQWFGVRYPLEPRPGVALGLQFDRGEPGPPVVGLGLDDANGPPVGKENVVGRSDVGLVFAYRHTQAGVEVESFLVLHMPASRPEAPVDPVAGDFFRGLVNVLRHSITHSSTLPRRSKSGPTFEMAADFSEPAYLLYSILAESRLPRASKKAIASSLETLSVSYKT